MEKLDSVTYCRTIAPKWKQRLDRDYVRLLQQTNSTRTPLHDVRYLHHRYWIEHWLHNRAVLSIPGTVDGAVHGPHLHDRGPTYPRCPSLQHLQQMSDNFSATTIKANIKCYEKKSIKQTRACSYRFYYIETSATCDSFFFLQLDIS